MTLAVGQKQPIFATAYDRQGNLIATAKFTFWSSDTTIAKVSRDGTVLGIAAGLAKVEARTQGRRASLAVLITGASAAGPPDRCSRWIPRRPCCSPARASDHRPGGPRGRLDLRGGQGGVEVAQARGGDRR